MIIHLPDDLESSIQAAVQGGRFASVDQAMARAARLLLRELDQGLATWKASPEESPDPLLGCMRDDVGLMDEMVADAYLRRREEPWRGLEL